MQCKITAKRDRKLPRYRAGAYRITHAMPTSLAHDSEPCDTNYVTRSVKKPCPQFYDERAAA